MFNHAEQSEEGVGDGYAISKCTGVVGINK